MMPLLQICSIGSGTIDRRMCLIAARTSTKFGLVSHAATTSHFPF